jgi:hypothetical protein
MQTKRFLLALVLVAGAILVNGCIIAAVGLGAGSVAYVRGDLESIELGNIDTVYKAAEKAMDQLDLKVIQKAKDVLSAEIIARDSQDTKIKIKLKATTEGPTELSIRIGLFGDEAESRLIYQKIHDNLR